MFQDNSCFNRYASLRFTGKLFSTSINSIKQGDLH